MPKERPPALALTTQTRANACHANERIVQPQIWDDRGDSAGVKFTDTDLIGLPLRITLGKRSLQTGSAEFRRRGPGSGEGEKWIMPLDSAVDAARQTLADIEADIIAGAKELAYGEHLR